MFFAGITAVFLLLLLVIFLGVFLVGPKQTLPTTVFDKSKIEVDMSIFSSNQFKNLQPYTKIDIQYSYKATTKDKKTKSGFISATSINDAKTKLKNQGLTVATLKEVTIGRNNPFIPYYTVTKLNQGTGVVTTQSETSITVLAVPVTGK